MKLARFGNLTFFCWAFLMKFLDFILVSDNHWHFSENKVSHCPENMVEKSCPLIAKVMNQW